MVVFGRTIECLLEPLLEGLRKLRLVSGVKVRLIILGNYLEQLAEIINRNILKFIFGDAILDQLRRENSHVSEVLRRQFEVGDESLQGLLERFEVFPQTVLRVPHQNILVHVFGPQKLSEVVGGLAGLAGDLGS